MTYDEIRKIPCNVIATYPPEQIDYIVDEVVDHYYEVGFPFYEWDYKRIVRDYMGVKNSSIGNIQIGDQIQQNMAGLYFVNYFHPEMWSVVCNKAKTPMDVYLDRELFKTAIRKRIGLSDTPLHPYNIRKSLKVFGGAQSVSNFRPTVAKYIYDKYCPVGGSVLDPCMGYGGRLMGANLSKNVDSYTCCDPNTVTVENNWRMQAVLDSLAEQTVGLFEEPKVTNITMNNIPFEEYPNLDEKFDLIFTSPPYFDIEKYSNDETQSWVRYNTLDNWLDGFLKSFVQISAECLKPDGYFIVNIDGGDRLIKPFLEIAASRFDLVDTKYMRLSKIIGSRSKNKDKFKLEPIFIFKLTGQ